MANPLTFGSVCSGIEAVSVAWEPLGVRADRFAQFDPEHNYSRGPDFPSAVLAHHWPHVPNLGDMTTLKARIASGEVKAPPILVGGTPCQAFSVAGAREGLDDLRGQLSLEFIKIADAIDEKRKNDECVILWENVPGVLSDKQNAFGCFLGALVGEDCELQPSGKKWTNAGCVFGPKRTAAWRVLDAQYFGVAQRRKRVFVVASARAGFRPTEVLFESEGVRRDTPPSRETKEVVAALTASGVGTCGADDNQAQAGHLVGHRMVAFGEYADDETASTSKARDYKDATDLVVHGTQDPGVSDVAYAMGTNGGRENALFSIQNATRGARQNGLGIADEISPIYTLDVGSQHGVCFGGVRRLIPVEGERLQGFPDDHTKTPWRGKSAEDCPDSHRYKAIGNSMAVPVIRWLGQRITNEVLHHG